MSHTLHYLTMNFWHFLSFWRKCLDLLYNNIWLTSSLVLSFCFFPHFQTEAWYLQLIQRPSRCSIVAKVVFCSDRQHIYRQRISQCRSSVKPKESRLHRMRRWRSKFNKLRMSRDVRYVFETGVVACSMLHVDVLVPAVATTDRGGVHRKLRASITAKKQKTAPSNRLSAPTLTKLSSVERQFLPIYR